MKVIKCGSPKKEESWISGQKLFDEHATEEGIYVSRQGNHYIALGVGSVSRPRIVLFLSKSTNEVHPTTNNRVSFEVQYLHDARLVMDIQEN